MTQIYIHIVPSIMYHIIVHAYFDEASLLNQFLWYVLIQ